MAISDEMWTRDTNAERQWQCDPELIREDFALVEQEFLHVPWGDDDFSYVHRVLTDVRRDDIDRLFKLQPNDLFEVDADALNLITYLPIAMGRLSQKHRYSERVERLRVLTSDGELSKSICSIGRSERRLATLAEKTDAIRLISEIRGLASLGASFADSPRNIGMQSLIPQYQVMHQQLASMTSAIRTFHLRIEFDRKCSGHSSVESALDVNRRMLDSLSSVARVYCLHAAVWKVSHCVRRGYAIDIFLIFDATFTYALPLDPMDMLNVKNDVPLGSGVYSSLNWVGDIGVRHLGLGTIGTSDWRAVRRLQSTIFWNSKLDSDRLLRTVDDDGHEGVGTPIIRTVRPSCGIVTFD